MENTKEIKMDKSKIWICEDCGREYTKLPFPEGCKCGNWCEEFFREKDRFDYEDDETGVPLSGIVYDSGVLTKREERLKKHKAIITQKISEEETPIKVKFNTMKVAQLKKYLDAEKSIILKRSDKISKKDLIKECKRIEKLKR